MASVRHLTCLAGLDLALKWTQQGSDLDIARCTAAVAHECSHRECCCELAECTKRLKAIDSLLESRVS